MAGEGAHDLAELVALGLLEHVAEVVRGHLVGLVHDDEVPVGVLQLGDDVVVPREVVEPGDHQVLLGERVPAAGALDRLARHDLEVQAELVREFVLPLLDQGTGADDEAALDVAPDEELLDEEARHDGLARTRVISQQEPERLARQELAVDRRDLVRQRLEHRGVDGEERVEEVGEADPEGLGDQAEQGPVPVEGEGRTRGLDLQARLIVPVEELLSDPAGLVAVGQGEGLGAVPVDLDHRDRPVGQHTAYPRARGEVLDPCHRCYLHGRTRAGRPLTRARERGGTALAGAAGRARPR